MAQTGRASRGVRVLALAALAAPGLGGRLLAAGPPVSAPKVTVTVECLGLVDASLVDCRALGSQPKSTAAEQVAVLLAGLRKGKPPADWPIEGRPVTMQFEVEPPDALSMAPPPPPPVIYSAAELVMQPSRIQIDQAYPPAARAARVGGAVQMRCRVGADGRLYACTVAGESPAGLGFGQAALNLQGLFAMARRTEGGAPGETTVPVVFRPPGE